jgi:hypothetical protein
VFGREQQEQLSRALGQRQLGFTLALSGGLQLVLERAQR